jgi:hypothetical protein
MDSHILNEAEEVRAEREAICEIDGLMTKAQAEKQGLLESERYLLSNQIRFVCAMQGKADRDAYFELVTKRDGQDYADRLRGLAMKHWNEKKGKK